MHAALEDFLQFAESRREVEIDGSTIELLYEEFLGNLSPSDQPQLFAIGGSPGAGKTTLRRQLKMENVHLHDMDELLIRLPGYQEDLQASGAKKAFEKWWPTAQKIARTLVLYAIESGYSIIYDRTCGTEGSYFDLRLAKARGYHIHLTGLTVDREVAKERILKREREEGRAVTEEILDEYRARFSALWPYYLELVDEIALYQTNPEIPRLIFSSTEGVLDEQSYQEFLRDGDSFRDYFAQKLMPR